MTQVASRVDGARAVAQEDPGVGLALALARQVERMDRIEVDQQDHGHAIEELAGRISKIAAALTVGADGLVVPLAKRCPNGCALGWIDHKDGGYMHDVYRVQAPDWATWRRGEWPTRPTTPEFVLCPVCGGKGRVQTEMGDLIAAVVSATVREAVKPLRDRIDALERDLRHLAETAVIEDKRPEERRQENAEDLPF